MRIMPISVSNKQAVSRNQSQSNYSSQPSFEGGMKDIMKKMSNSKIKENALRTLREHLAGRINVEPEELAPLTKSLNSRKTAFVSHLIRRLGQEENVQLGAPALEKIKETLLDTGFVTRNHISLIKHSNYTVEELSRIYKAVKDSPQKNELMSKLLNTAQDSSKKTHINSFAMKEFLEMKQVPELNRNYALYKPFIEVNAEFPHAAKVLTQQLENKTFNPEYYKKIADITSMKKKFDSIKLVDDKVLTNNYSHEGLTVLGRLDIEYSSKGKYIDTQSEFLTSIYKSTNEKNSEIRNAIIKRLVKDVPVSQVENKASIETLDYIFNSVDYRPDVRKFVEIVLDKNINISSPEMLSEIISKVNLNKVNENLPNLKRIIRLSKNDNNKLIKLLNENIENTNYLKKCEVRFERQELRDGSLKYTNPMKYKFQKAVLNFKERLLDLTK